MPAPSAPRPDVLSADRSRRGTGDQGTPRDVAVGKNKSPGSGKLPGLEIKSLTQLIQERDLAEHLRAQRQDDREAVVPLHPADRNPDQLPVAVQHAAARHARVTVGEAG